MKNDIHPEYHKIKASCACGNEFELGSVEKEINVEICSACHPFFIEILYFTGIHT